MANPNIQFTDATGSLTLTNTSPRFASWVPIPADIGQQAVSMGTGLTYQFVFRRDNCASFEVKNIRPKDVSTAIRLMYWLESGGSVTVNTADVNSNSYTCVLQPNQHPKLTFDSKMLEYTLALNLLNTAGTPLITKYSSV